MKQNNPTFKPIEIEVSTSTPIRIDKFVQQHLDISRTKTQLLFEQQNVYLNDKISKKNSIVKDGDSILIKIFTNPNKINITLQPYKTELDIAYEDKDMMIVNKPSGMLIHPTGFNETDTLANALVYYFNEHYPDCQPGIVHRLDKDTSGLIIIAKNLEALHLLQAMVANHLVEKTYYALVNDNFSNDHMIVEAPIARSFQDKLRMQVGKGKNSKFAKTEFFICHNYHQYALIKCLLHTGRTHQIRVHLRYINHPIINDPLYGTRDKTTTYGQYLHAYKLKFIHPILHKEIVVELPLPNEFSEYINSHKE